MLGILQDEQDRLAPLSKRYRLTEEEARSIPKNIKSFLEEIETEISSCKNPERVKILARFRNQTNKYQDNLKSTLKEYWKIIDENNFDIHASVNKI